MRKPGARFKKEKRGVNGEDFGCLGGDGWETDEGVEALPHTLEKKDWG